MSRLLEGSDQFRDPLISKNSHTKNDEYAGTHPNALSDGDEKGKGESNGQVGSATDIRTRKTLEARNQYNRNNEYGIGNA
jgi:hypothetical protein